MLIFDQKLIHDRRLFAVEGVSPETGRKVLAQLQSRGEISPQRSPTGRTYLSPAEAARFHDALHAA